MQKMDHPCLVKYIEHFKIEVLNVPQIFLVMEFVEGKTLKARMQEKTISNPEDLIKKILMGLNILHDAKIIHRDLKPENIIVQEDDEIKILDYGLAKLIDYTSITSTGDILGTYAYMSPEQITDSKNVDSRSDLYSLGVIFYQLLTGEFPYTAQLVPEFIDKIKNESPIPLRKWDRSILNKHENIVLKLLEKEPYKRYQDIQQIVEEFQKKRKLAEIIVDDEPRFVLRTYDEKSVLEVFMKDKRYNRKLWIGGLRKA